MHARLFFLIALYESTLGSSTQSLCASSSPRLPGCQVPGSPCTSEGQWNCLTDSWQRCADGAWTADRPCAEGTICVPAGLTHDLMILHGGGGAGSSRDAASPSAHDEGDSAGRSVLAAGQGGLALAALLVHSWVVAGR